MMPQIYFVDYFTTAMSGGWEQRVGTGLVDMISTLLHDNGVLDIAQEHLQRRYIMGEGKTTGIRGRLI
jgi:hypothetical protein